MKKYNTQKIHIHLISDSTGETVSTVARSAGAHFKDFNTVEHNWVLVRSLEQINKILKDLQKDSPSIIDVDEWKTNHYDTSPTWPYEQTFFSLVSETHFVQDTLNLSEKLYKSMANNHLFIVVGTYGTLKSLQERGFKTFEPYIDESYDKEKDPYKRIKMIVIEVERLCKLSDREMKEIIVKTEEVVKYNYDTLINDHHSINVAFKELEAIINA